MRVDRIRELETYLQRKESATLPELCDYFNVSLNTIRRDIKVLQVNGRVTKVYGGVLYNPDDAVVPVHDRSHKALPEKDHIGSLAASLVEDNDTIYLDSGTTTLHMLPHLKQYKNLTIVSNSFLVYNEMQHHPEISLFSTGGLYNHKTKSFVSMGAVDNLKDIRISKAFMGATGVSIEQGATNNSFHEAQIKKAVVKIAQKVILMADHSKLDVTAAVCFSSLANLYAYITDTRPPQELVEFFKNNNIKLLY
ncbi:MAG: DeoR/GlpR transcriptional regulator [Ruminococcaceae bacterium]|nr:DeoR/GlpR transcriptional regulator [Oscillospiraceae bacterium]